MKKLRQAIIETKEFMNLNRQRDIVDDNDDGSFSDDDAMEELESECGRGRDGSCSLAGTEYCDWECPFS
jgi:hypothetical protein